MSLANVKDWIRNHISTTTWRGDEVVAVVHPAGDCPHCPNSHPVAAVERMPLDELATRYQTVMEDAPTGSKSIPDKDPANVRDAAITAATDRGTKHERYFEQA